MCWNVHGFYVAIKRSEFHFYNYLSRHNYIMVFLYSFVGLLSSYSTCSLWKSFVHRGYCTCLVLGCHVWDKLMVLSTLLVPYVVTFYSLLVISWSLYKFLLCDFTVHLVFFFFFFGYCITIAIWYAGFRRWVSPKRFRVTQYFGARQRYS